MGCYDKAINKIKSRLSLSISGWERNNKLITKVVYRYQDSPRNKGALGGLVPHQWPKE